MRAAIDLGVELKRNRAALGLMRDGDKVVGVETYAENFPAGTVICAMGPWSGRLAEWTGLDIPLEISRHTVLTFIGDQRYAAGTPIVKDLATENKMYFRPTTGGAVLVGAGDHGEPIATLDEIDTAIPMDFVAHQGGQISHRMSGFADCHLGATWHGPYDITPDWNPVLGAVPERDGLIIAYGFSGHGFKLAPAVGKVLAQTALGEVTDIDIAPYALSRFVDRGLRHRLDFLICAGAAPGLRRAHIDIPGVSSIILTKRRFDTSACGRFKNTAKAVARSAPVNRGGPFCLGPPDPTS